MNDEQLDKLIRSSLEWHGERGVRHAPSLAQSARRVAERLGPQSAPIRPVVTARFEFGRSLQLLLAVLLLALVAAAAAILVGSRRQESTLLTGPIGSLAVGRGPGHAAVGLPDGRVLVVGGWLGFRPVGSAELWDATTGTFSAAGALDPARNHATATLLQDGRILAAGGFAGQYEYPSNAVATAELWDPASRTFSATGSLLTARAAHGAILLNDGRVAIYGGGPTELWDPATGHFREFGPAADGTATLLDDGRVLFVDGPSGMVWDPGSARASDAGRLVSARTSATAALLLDGRVLVIGGRVHPPTGEFGTLIEDGRFQIVADQGSPSRLASAELWDPRTEMFSPAGSLTRGRIGHTATLLPDGRVLVLGGEGVVDVAGNRGYRDFPGPELWDPATGAFSAASPLIRPRTGHSAILLADGRVLVVGGKGGPGDAPLQSVEIYDPNSGTLPTPAP